MLNLMPKYKNFKFLDGNLDSFKEQKYCVFVLMPFANKELNGFFETIKETVEKGCFHGNLLKCNRADSETDMIIMENICTRIKQAELTIFDISIPNLNVYYELGLACALDKKIILTYNPELYYKENEKEKLPFDINQFRYLEYRNNEELKQKLKRVVEEIIDLEVINTVSLENIYKKLQKVTKHFNLDSKAEQIREDWNISDYEVEEICNILNEYWNNKDLKKNEYKDVDYIEIEIKVRHQLNTNNWNRVKQILISIYWDGYYQQLIAKMSRSPREFYQVKKDYLKKIE